MTLGAAAALSALLLGACQAQAAGRCYQTPHEMRQFLEAFHELYQSPYRVADDGKMVLEFWAGPRSWTMVGRLVDGKSCVVESGQWEGPMMAPRLARDRLA